MDDLFPCLHVTEVSNGYLVQVQRPNPKYRDLVKQARNVPPGGVIQTQEQEEDDDEEEEYSEFDPRRMMMGMMGGTTLIKRPPEPMLAETLVFPTYSLLLEWLQQNPMGVPPVTPEPTAIEEEQHLGDRDRDLGGD